MSGPGAMVRYAATALRGMVWPRVCCVCGCSLPAGQELLCMPCHAALPRYTTALSDFNTIHERLAQPGLPVDKAMAWFRYNRHSPYSAIVVDAKYRGLPRLAREAGRLMALELGAAAFAGIDVVTYVPMSPWKQLRRGYNQAREAALGLAGAVGLPVAALLETARGHATQTRRSAAGRQANARGVYRAAPQAHALAAGKHVLVVDDVVTTGSTMRECLLALRPHAAALSVAALGATELD